MKITSYKTVKGASPMQKYEHTFTKDGGYVENFLINIYPEIEYQEIKGFGGAFTEAAAVTLDKLSKSTREKVIKMYFDKEEGIGYNFGRVHINSCDFALGNYTCVEEGDLTLESFQIERDKKSVIPMIKEALAYTDIELFASPWSPPAYMKTSGRMNRGGRLRREYYPLWAEYYKKFIKAYEKEGVKIFAITVQNEPNAEQTWDSCLYSAEEERDFVRDYLGKKMSEIGVKIFFWDHNRERIIERSRVMLSDKAAAREISGIAFHWYSGEYYEELEAFHKLYPEMDILFSEGCCKLAKNSDGALANAERYARDMIGNFSNYCSYFCDWNLLLDEKGGPNHVGNFHEAPILANTETDELYIRDSFYYIAHFSKFIKKGAGRIATSRFSDKIEAVSFKNPDGSVVTVVLNRTDSDVDYTLRIAGNLVSAKSEAHSIATYLFENI